MSTQTSIEWTEQTWNPAVGCTKISSGCAHCYAEVMARRLKAMRVPGYENGFQVTILPHRLEEPLNRTKPTVYFVNSMSDLFHEDIPDDYIRRVFDVIQRSPQHTFQVLTKRAERMATFFSDYKPPRNAWLGVTVEDKKHGLPRLMDLQQTNAINKHICCEPLLEDLGAIDLTQMKWVVGGGESGPNARPAKLSWVESLLHQCEIQNVHLYWKQWGTFASDGTTGGKSQTGCLINGKAYLSFPDDLMP